MPFPTVLAAALLVEVMVGSALAHQRILYCPEGKSTKYKRVYFTEGFNKPLLKDPICTSEHAVGGWCEWEPLETGHGVTRCQTGLNIRWRRRLCRCPPPSPIEDHSKWCRLGDNATRVAQLADIGMTRQEALKLDVWDAAEKWTVKNPFSRPGQITNSLLGCIELRDCYFHTGGSYTGSVAVTRTKAPCVMWEKYKKALANNGMTTADVYEFFKNKPKNYCRNPLAKIKNNEGTLLKLKPWCITGPPEKDIRDAGYSWEYCDIPSCGSHDFHGTLVFRNMPDDHLAFRRLTEHPYGGADMNAENCFATCRFRCERIALIHQQKDPTTSQRFITCQCFNDSIIKDIRGFSRTIDGYYPSKLQYKSRNKAWAAKLGMDLGTIQSFLWTPCKLFNSYFSCPYVRNSGIHNRRNFFASTFELALPRNCQETNRLMKGKRVPDPITIFGTMGEFLSVASGIRSLKQKKFLLSSRAHKGSTALETMCTHRSPRNKHCPGFNENSRTNTNSYFNSVVDAGYQWLIMDLGSYYYVGGVILQGTDADLLPLEVLTRSASLPTWIEEVSFTSSDGPTGLKTVYFQRASNTERSMWWPCETVKKHTGAADKFYATCSPHMRSRWIMLRQIINSDLLEMRYNLGYSWLKPQESCCIRVQSINVQELIPHGMNCLTMHHPPMGPEYADYWEDLYSFDGDGQSLDPPVNTPVHPQFRLPLLSHDSMHPDENFVQEDWDVEACGNWDILHDTIVIGVPKKLKISFTAKESRGENCYRRKDGVGQERSDRCIRDVYFRVDNLTGEVIHYPDFGRSYDLTASQRNCQFVCAVARECKAFEFLHNAFCRLHLISYKVDNMFAHATNVIYGRKSDIMLTTNPYTWNNPFHPYYRMLQDLLTETGFFR